MWTTWSHYFNLLLARWPILTPVFERSVGLPAHDWYGVTSSSIELNCCAGIMPSSPLTYGEIAVGERRDPRGNIARSRKKAPSRTSGRIMTGPRRVWTSGDIES